MREVAERFSRPEIVLYIGMTILEGLGQSPGFRFVTLSHFCWGQQVVSLQFLA